MLEKVACKGFSFVEQGVCAAKGFKAAGIHCGLRKNKDKKDLALVYSKQRCQGVAVYTKNQVKGAPLLVTKQHLQDDMAQAIVINSGNANTCLPNGVDHAKRMCELVGESLQLPTKDVLVASTGIIGQPLDITPIETHMQQLAKQLNKKGGAQHAAEAILTTDTKDKQVAVTFFIGDTCCTIGGMAKGSGMIHPNMATMLCFITTDVDIETLLLKQALSRVTEETFNMVSVDGDTSTNDMVVMLANGMAKNPSISSKESEEYQQFCNGLYAVMMNLSRMIAGDGEGASKLLECVVTGAADHDEAKKVAKSVISSNLVKCAMFGEDEHGWGRILCAIGYSGVSIVPQEISVTFQSAGGKLMVCHQGVGLSVEKQQAAKILEQDEIKIIISIGEQGGSAVAWGCDLTQKYININCCYGT